MQDGALSLDGDGQGKSRATCKDAKHRSSSGGYKTRRRKNGMTIPNILECLYLPLGGKCGNTAKGNSGGVREGI